MHLPIAAAARSFLFVPGDRPDRFAKAWDSRADVVILDLEDAVSVERKTAAREHVAAWLREDRPAWVRCNAADTPWFEEDLRLAQRPGLAGFVVPKAQNMPEALRRAVADHRIGWIPLVETAVGMDQAPVLARHPGVVRLAFGTLDFQLDLGIEGDDEALHCFRSKLVLASRLGGCASPIDGVTVALDDDARLHGDALRARRFGFGAKLCIHPRQVPAVHAAFEPTADERAWAQRVLDATRASNGAAVAVDGRMVDRPVWLRAQRVHEAPAASCRMRGA